MSVPVRIELLGGFRLTVAGRTVTSLPRKAEALLAYLAMQDGRPVTRESAADLLWTNRGAEQARNSLRETLRVVRRDVGGLISRGQPLLAFVPGMVEADVGRFRLMSRSSDRAELAEATQAYRDELLHGFPPIAGDFDDWLRSARAELADQAIDTYRRLVDTCLSEGDARSAVVAAEPMLALDVLREDSHRKVMEVYLLAGRRADAVRQYKTCVDLLWRELGVKPADETRNLGHTLISDTDPLDPPPSRPLFATAHLMEGPPRIAVLPFDLSDGNPIPEHLGDGLVEDIIGQLAGLRDLNVISHGTTRTLRNRNISITDIGRDINARYVVRGHIRRSGDLIRLNTELTEVATSRVIWSRRSDAEASLSFQDQDRIVGQIVHSLTPMVHETEILRIRGKRTDDLSLYERVLLARDYLNRLGVENFRKALGIMEAVIAHEPPWGEAYAVAADCHGLLLAEGWSNMRDHHVANIEHLSRKALELDRSNVRALTFYAHRRTIFHHDFDTAIELYRRALETAPGSAATWLWSSITYSHACDGDEAILRAERALSLSPADQQAYWFYLALCMAYYVKREFDVAADWGMKALAEPATGRTGPRRVAAALVGAGRITIAKDLGRVIVAEDPSIRVRDIVANSTFRDHSRREEFGQHLALAGIPV